MTPSDVLKEYWGYDSFRPMQKDIIDAALEGRDVLALLPTGGGKSVCFQVPGMMREGLSIVVTPLIALMKDQVQNLSDRGIRALSIHSGMSRREVELALNNAAYGDCKFLYVSPERLGTGMFKSYLEVLPVNFIVIDEAHCISQWGYDFRPDYLEIGAIRDVLDVPVIALTATATEAVAADIMEKLRFREPLLLKSGFERANLSYIVRKVESKLEQLRSICNGVEGSGIVYMRHRNRCEEIASFLSSTGVSASFYHAGLDSRTRGERQARWKSGEIRVMVCTNAFGMGIDKPDVRFVVHMDLPDSIEAYFQEAGRAGRDEKRSYAVLLWNDNDRRRLLQIEKTSFPPLDYIEDIYDKLHVFYRIPYDQGMGRQLKFDLAEFAGHFSLDRAGVSYALKYLERTSHIVFEEDMEICTEVKVTVDRAMLDELAPSLPDRRMLVVLENIMRSYPAVFSYLVPIDEPLQAEKCSVTVSQYRQLLYGLSLEHVINYVPADRSTVIILRHDRLQRGNVDLQPGLFRHLKESWHTRSEAMYSYASTDEVCRSAQLVAYFGQRNAAPCGECDVCRSDGTAAVIRYVETHPGYSLEEIASFAANPAVGFPKDWAETLRVLVDSGRLDAPRVI
ncbi:MAG: RecQ family ATP-dependent DNA helicase [Bacteroidales bacterium]|nr:RecQ family ATP-dependent DNA helicase [Bacteroidales bacterium]